MTVKSFMKVFEPHKRFYIREDSVVGKYYGLFAANTLPSNLKHRRVKIVINNDKENNGISTIYIK